MQLNKFIVSYIQRSFAIHARRTSLYTFHKCFFCNATTHSTHSTHKFSKNMTTIEVQPQGEYATIDVASTKAVILSLRSTDKPEELQATINEVQSNPQKYAPPAFFALSHAMFAQGARVDAAFWFYAGQLRARYDSMRCADVSASSAVSVLNDSYGPPINQYMFQHIDQLKELIPRVIAFDEQTPHSYDHRWINLHGMGAFTNTTPLSLPQDQWNALEQQARTNYKDGFDEMMKEYPQLQK